ncbi:WD40 repeat domain-containing protein [Candidatus Babeliales bacterium]|nr:WD40 repeat domain-containing protein [Candidatus Babeliales bacterium]
MKKLFILLFCFSNLSVFSQAPIRSLSEQAAEQAVREHLSRWLDDMKSPDKFEQLNAELNLPEKVKSNILKLIDTRYPSTIFLYTFPPQELKMPPSYTASTVAWSPDGKKIASGSGNNNTTIWDVKTGSPKWIFKKSSRKKSLAWSPDSRKLADISANNSIRIWDVETGKIIDILQEEYDVGGQPQAVSFSTMAFSPDGRRIAIGTSDGYINLINLKTKEQEHQFRASRNAVISIAWSPDGQNLAGGFFNGIVNIWNATTRAKEKTLSVDRPVTSMAWSSDGKCLAIGNINGEVTAWNIRTTRRKDLPAINKSRVNSVAWSPDNRIIFSGSDDGIISLWNIETRNTYVLRNPSNKITSLALSPDGKTIATAEDNNTIKLWMKTDYSDSDLKKALLMILITTKKINTFNITTQHLIPLYNSLSEEAKQYLEKTYNFPEQI